MQQKAEKAYALLRSDPRHPSLHLKNVGQYWSARVDRGFRALAIEHGSDLMWFWIGSHAEYDRLIKSA